MNPFREEAVTLISRHAGLDPAEVASALSRPPKPEMGDFAFPCFQLAKREKSSADKLAADLAQKLGSDLDLLESAEGAGPYVNLRVARGKFAEVVLREALRAGEDVGRSREGEGRTIVIDYSSPNVAKPFHVGHMRSTIIGSALYRLFRNLGFKVIGINHLGDWGTQFGKQIVSLKRWGKPEDVLDLTALNKLYVKYHEEEEKHPELAGEAREWFRKLEAGEADALKLWDAIREASLLYLRELYSRLGVEFDQFQGESFYNDKMEPIVEAAKKLEITQLSEGALVVDLKDQGIDTPALLEKGDGTTLYMTRDVAAAIYRKATYKFDKMLYVVGSGQGLHFKQLFGVLRRMGKSWADDCIHIAFGLVKGMSTRKGNVIFLEELLDEAKERALRYMAENVEKRGELQADEEEAVAEAVGQAAIFFSDLSKQRIKDYTFSWEQAISFDGDTGPYLLNAHARIAGIIRKCGVELDPEADLSPLAEPEAHELVSCVSRYPDVLREAAAAYEPSILTNYLLDLAHGLHASYARLRVKDEEERVAKARLILFKVVKDVLASGMRIIGLKPLERM